MKTVTITSQGQITIPASVRREIGVKGGDKLSLSYNSFTRKLELEKPQSLDEIADRLTSLIKPGTKPVTNASKYYQKHRGETVR